MSTSPAEQPVPGLVTFTAQGNRALDRLAAKLVDQCDGSPASIAELLDQVLSADIEELADKLEGPVETPPAVEDPDQAAGRRLRANRPTAGGPAQPPAIGR